MMKYRKADLFDVETLTQMRIAMLCDETNYSQEFRGLIQNNTKQYIANGFNDKSFVSWVAVQDDMIVAMSGINFFVLPPNDWCPTGKTAYIGNLYTLPNFRKQGIATHLLALIIDEAKSRNCERILLNTTDMGRVLYEKLGFDLSPTAMALYPFGIIPTT